jgi:subtilase family serine protease
MALSMAPGLSEIIVYEGLFPNDILNRMATDNQAKQLSSSWGFGPQVDPIRQQIYKQFAVQGQTMFQASGDLGAWTAEIFAPSDDPLLTIVGGTSLATNPKGEWESETTWPGSGGGISTVYSIPSWQLGIDMSANQGSASMRNIPDVAAMADSGIWLVANNGEFFLGGGTSASAPLWAGFTALVNERAATSGKPSVGFLNPALYSIGKELSYASNCHDITTGDNINNSVGKFSAVPGYDLCTGWGTPRGTNLVTTLVAFSGAVWVAFGTPGPGDGSYTNAFNTLARATNAVPSAGTIAIKAPATTAETISIAKPMTLRAAGGPISIGH